MKRFNTTAICIPSEHYMVDISARVAEIRKLVDEGKYFTINRARQYGKTTTLDALHRAIKDQYLVLSIDFQDIEDGSFENGGEFSKAFARMVLDAVCFDGLEIPAEIEEELRYLNEQESKQVRMDELFRVFRRWFAEENKPIVLMIDEVDSATNNQVFLDFLSGLRSLYLKRAKNPLTRTFQSVILAGVTDVKHLKRKIREEDQHKVNSPWNIAADFDIDMSLQESGIQSMLDVYEADHGTGMNTGEVAGQIRNYTGGYPYLVSRICQIIDEKLVPEKFASLHDAWTVNGLTEAIKIITTEDNTLFESMMGKLTNYPDLNEQLQKMLLQGESIEYLPDNEAQKQLRMYGFIVNDHNTVMIANRIFEIRLYKKYIGESKLSDGLRPDALDHKPEFIKDGNLNVPLIMERFIEKHAQIWGTPTEKTDVQGRERFLEEEGRRRFLTYLSPIINGVGTYEIEPQTRDRRRMDVVIHYLGKRYIIELKIWRGERYHAAGEQQISEYLDNFNLTTGYMLSFNFNQNKKTGVERVQIGNKVLFEGTV